VPGSVIYTDEATCYTMLSSEGFRHDAVPHAQRVYVRGPVHTNTIEGFFALLKGGILGTYHSVSPKHLGSYVNEFVWRYNHRDDDRTQFRTLIENAASPI
jgi:transposase-like protein